MRTIRQAELSTEELEQAEALLLLAMRGLFARDDADTPALELPLAQLRAMNVLYESDGPATMRRMAEGLGIALSTATEIVDRLVRGGLVVRADDPGDRRVVRVALSEAGRALVEERRARRRRRLGEALSRLSEPERRRVLDGLALLAGSASQPSEGPPDPTHLFFALAGEERR